MIEKINQLEKGSVISESSHYIVDRVAGSTVHLKHFESGEDVQIGISYLKNYTNSADLYDTTVEVTNPVLPYEEGEDRVLRGYKIQFESRDGRYDCVDMDIVRTDKESGIRPVNINTIKWLIFNGVKIHC